MMFVDNRFFIGRDSENIDHVMLERSGLRKGIKNEKYINSNLSTRHITAKNPLYPSAFNGFTAGWGGVKRGGFGVFVSRLAFQSASPKDLPPVGRLNC